MSTEDFAADSSTALISLSLVEMVRIAADPQQPTRSAVNARREAVRLARQCHRAAVAAAIRRAWAQPAPRPWAWPTGPEPTRNVTGGPGYWTGD